MPVSPSLHARPSALRQQGGILLKLLLGLVILLLIGAALLFKLRPELFTMFQSTPTIPVPSTAQVPVKKPKPIVPPSDSRQLVQAVLLSSEDVLGELMARGDQVYKKPQSQLFEGSVSNPCTAPAKASGTFYCARNKTLYIDLGQLQQLQRDYPAEGAVAQAYLIMRSVSQHASAQTGLYARFKMARQIAGKGKEGEELKLRFNLLKDCFTGVWAGYARKRLDWLEERHLSAALIAANVVTQRRLQQDSTSQWPEPISHGTSSQREYALKQGFESGDPMTCDPFIRP